jgi:DNA-binding GntR family transcriptional regulator
MASVQSRDLVKQLKDERLNVKGSAFEKKPHGSRKLILPRPLEPIPIVEATQQAAHQIRHAIISGHYKPGDRLIERELTEQLHVSRHPVREALRLLAREGFVDLHRNRGAQVSSVDESSVTEVYAIRMALGRLALERLIRPGGIPMPQKELKRLETLKDRAMRCAKLKRHDDAVAADMDFQQAIVDASDLSRVKKYFRELTDDVRRFDALLGIVYTDQENYVKKYIASLYHAISDGNLSQAQSIWQGKFEKAVERFLAAIAGREVEGVIRSR